jgi:hypothetical protein
MKNGTQSEGVIVFDLTMVVPFLPDEVFISIPGCTWNSLMFRIKLMKGIPKVIKEGLDWIPMVFRVNTEGLQGLSCLVQHLIPDFGIPLPVQSTFHSLMIRKT